MRILKVLIRALPLPLVLPLFCLTLSSCQFEPRPSSQRQFMAMAAVATVQNQREIAAAWTIGWLRAFVEGRLSHPEPTAPIGG